MNAVGHQSGPESAIGRLLRSRHKENKRDLLVCANRFFSQKTGCREYRPGGWRNCETGGGAAPACSCCTDSHTKCTLVNYCLPLRLQWGACYKFVTSDKSWLKIAAFDFPDPRAVLSQLRDKNFQRRSNFTKLPKICRDAGLANFVEGLMWKTGGLKMATPTGIEPVHQP